MAKPKSKQAVTVKTRFKKPKLRPTFIRQWREHRGLTQGRLAERVELSTATISQIETGKQGYSQENLEAIAGALQCEVVDLLIRDPSDPDGIWTLLDQVKPEDQKRLVGMIKGFLNSSAA